LDAEGLPVGVMFSARFGEDATLFRLAAQLEKAKPWAGRKPRGVKTKDSDFYPNLDCTRSVSGLCCPALSAELHDEEKQQLMPQTIPLVSAVKSVLIRVQNDWTGAPFLRRVAGAARRLRNGQHLGQDAPLVGLAGTPGALSAPGQAGPATSGSSI
jgi:hypothetical protein